MSRHPIDWAAIVAALLSLFGTIYIEATHNDRQNEHRITALESQRNDDHEALKDVQTEVHEIYQYLLGKQ